MGAFLPMTSCIIFLSLFGLVAGVTIVLPVIGAIADANTPKTPSVIDPGFPARSFEAKARIAATETKELVKKAWSSIVS